MTELLGQHDGDSLQFSGLVLLCSSGQFAYLTSIFLKKKKGSIFGWFSLQMIGEVHIVFVLVFGCVSQRVFALSISL